MTKSVVRRIHYDITKANGQWEEHLRYGCIPNLKYTKFYKKLIVELLFFDILLDPAVYPIVASKNTKLHPKLPARLVNVLEAPP